MTSNGRVYVNKYKTNDLRNHLKFSVIPYGDKSDAKIFSDELTLFSIMLYKDSKDYEGMYTT